MIFLQTIISNLIIIYVQKKRKESSQQQSLIILNHSNAPNIPTIYESGKMIVQNLYLIPP